MINKKIFLDLYFWKFSDAYLEMKNEVSNGVKVKKVVMNTLEDLSTRYGNIKVSGDNVLNRDISKKMNIVLKDTEWLDEYFE